MSNLKDHISLLNTIEDYLKLSSTVTIKGLNTLDISETRGWVIIKFACPDQAFPEYSFDVEFKVTLPFFNRHLKRLLKVE